MVPLCYTSNSRTAYERLSEGHRELVQPPTHTLERTKLLSWSHTDVTFSWGTHPSGCYSPFPVILTPHQVPSFGFCLAKSVAHFEHD